MNEAIDPLGLLTLITRLLCVGLLLQSIELLANARELRDDGLLGWRDLRGRLFGPQGKLRRLHTHPTPLLILAGRGLVAFLCLFLPFDAAVMPWLLGGLFGAQAYLNHRLKTIHEGSDTMFLIGLAAVAAAALEPAEPRLRVAALVFFAVQLLLAYFAAGWDKLRAASWRNGSLVTRALRHGAHRFEPLGNVLARRRLAAVVFSWHVILLELLFPLCVLLPWPAFWIFVAVGIAFHVAVAFCMGLHGFLWSFVAGYPALYFCARYVAGIVYGPLPGL